MGQSVLIFFNSRLGLSKYMNSVDNSVLILDKSPYKHQNETIVPYFSLIFGGGGGWRANGPFPCPIFTSLRDVKPSQNYYYYYFSHKSHPKNALHNLWTNNELLIIRAKFWLF